MQGLLLRLKESVTYAVPEFLLIIKFVFNIKIHIHTYIFFSSF